ncbi:MAG TPA: hypothetical protein VH299_08540 [Solirubrobacterales bacterium]|jgi:hypothetical protein|nr:hypothetical protein [Solirubrobacterales bacterium]
MLGPGRYLLGVVELIWLVGFAWIGAARVRRRWLPEVGGEAGFLAGAVVAVALLIWVAEVLGTVSLFKPVPYLVGMGVVGLVLWRFVPSADGGHPRSVPSRPSLIATVISLLIAGIAIGHFVSGVKLRLGTGMTGFDSTWYHGPFAAGFFQTGNTIDLHFIAPQFLAWFYPANSEVVGAIGMLAFHRDLLSPLLNLGWLLGCLLACWCIGRPFRVAPWSLALGAIALSVPALADQAGEARNDLVAVFFLLAAIAIALNAAVAAAGGSAEGSGGEPAENSGGRVSGSSGMAGRTANSPAGAPGDPPGTPGTPPPWASRRGGLSTGALLGVGLAVGLAAGTKLNFLLPAAVLVLGLTALAPSGRRWRTLVCSGGMALAGGGYWYLRNLIHTGNPLPWIHRLGPINLPAPEQALGGREAHSVLSYLTNGSVWSEWFLPGLHGGLWIIWPVVAAAALAGLVLTLVPFARSLRAASGREAGGHPESGHEAPSTAGRWAENRPHSQVFGPSTRAVAGVLALAGLVGLAAAVSWLVSPTSASGPDGVPRGFESGLRYLTPALILGFALLPTVPPLRAFAARLASLGPALGERPVPPRPVPSETPGQQPAMSSQSAVNSPDNCELTGRDSAPDGGLPRRWVAGIVAAAVILAVLVGYPVERHYLRDRYRDPSFTAPGLDAAFAWARDISGARIATTSTRQYPLFGTDLSNQVAYIGVDRPHGGFEAAQNCRQFRRLINVGNYDYVVATRDRIEAGKPAYPPQAKWTAGPNAQVVLKKAPTVVFRITGPLDPNTCP